VRILVTGGAGFIGSHLVEALLPHHTVEVLDNLSTGRRENLPSTVPLHRIDLRDAQALRQHFAEHTYEVVYHLAAQVDVRTSVEKPTDDAQVNILGTLHLLEAVRSSHAWVIFTSTGGAIYGEAPNLPIGETYAPLPESPYGIAKLAGELYLRHFHQAHGVPYTVLRLANVYGPRQNPHGEAGVVAIFTHRLLSGQPAYIYGDGEQTRDFVYVGDVVGALVEVLKFPQRTQGQVFNVGTGRQTSVNELWAHLARLIGTSQTPHHLPPKAGELRHNALSYQRLHEATGWKPQVSLEEGLAATVAAFRQRLES